MANIIIPDLYQGSSKYPTFFLKNKNNGEPIVIDDVYDIRVHYVNEQTGASLGKFSKIAATGWNSEDFVIINSDAGIFGLRIQSSLTKIWKIGIATVEIEVSETVTGFEPHYKSILKERIYNVLPDKITNL